MPYEDVKDYADLYDIVSQENNDGNDIDFYVERAKETDGKVLEVACGTGRIYLQMLEEGVEAYGIDLSEEMLEKLREKAEKRSLNPDVSQEDMRDFNLDEKFSLIIIPYRSFLHNLTIEDQLSTLDSIYRHLEDDGKLILNFYSPDIDFIAENYGKEKTREIQDGEYTLVENVEMIDSVNWIIEFEKKLVKDGEEKWSSKANTKMITRTEFELLLENSSFSDWEVYGGFDLEELEDSKQEMIWIVEK
ncbi:MAG: class I SAM-dependent methyltransferase [Candidatus Nanohaloarchaea archaeon]